MAEEPVAPAGEDLQLSLTPAQQAEDIERRMKEFNAELDPLCKKYNFVIAVVRNDQPNGTTYHPQLIDTKFAPKPPVQAPVEAPKVEVAEGSEEPVEEAPVEAPKAEEAKPAEAAEAPKE